MDFILCSTLMFVAYFLFHYFLVSTSQLCDGINGTICCSGFLWNKAMNECIPCMRGYFGEDCRFACPFPYFGERCQSLCRCSVEKCHHVYDCNRNHSHKCESGRFGDNCENTCRYPNYGEGCQLYCNCIQEHCNPFKGCIELESASTRPTSSEALSSSLAVTETSTVSEKDTKFSSLKTTKEDVSQGTSDLCSKKTAQLKTENSSSSLIFSIVGLLIIAGFSLVMYICIVLYRAPVQSSSCI